MQCQDVNLQAYSTECDAVNTNRIKSVSFYPETGKVYDEDGNFIGYGVLEDGILKIYRETE